MRVAMLLTRSDIVGGANVVVRDLCLGLNSRNVESKVLVGGTGPFLDGLKAAGIPYSSIPHLDRPISPGRDAAVLAHLYRILSANPPDLLACHAAKAGFLGRAVARRLGIPVVYTPHGWSFDEGVPRKQAFVYLMLERIGARLGGTILNVCHYDRQLAQSKRIGRSQQHVVVRNGIADVTHDLLACPGLEPPRIVMVARFEPQKDHETLIAALAGLTDRPWSLTLVGDGAGLDRARKRVEQLGLAERVAFSGGVPDASPYLAKSQIFAFASRWEGLPLAVLEAMRAGLPVIATGVGGIPEAIRHGHNGCLVPRGDVENLRACLKKLIDDPALRDRLGACGRATFREGFMQDRMIAETAEVYRKAVEQSRRQKALSAGSG